MHPLARSILAIAATSVILWIMLNVAFSGVVGLLFGQWLGLAAMAVAVVLGCVAIARLLRILTGKRGVAAAMTVTLTAIVSLVVAFVGFGTVPMIWVQPGFELVHVLVAVPAALIVGLFTGPLALRLLGLVGALALIAGGAWLIAPDVAQELGPSQGEVQAQQQAERNFEAFIANGVYPYVADIPQGSIWGYVQDGGPFRTLTTTDGGGVLEVVHDPEPIDHNPEIAPCWYLAQPDMGLESTDALADYANWCTKDADVWLLTDGTGFAWMNEDGGLIAVRAAVEQNVKLADGERPANATEVAQASDAVRPMTEQEARDYMHDIWVPTLD